MADDEMFRIAQDTEAARNAAQALFDRVARELEPMLPASADVLHVGATAIPGCLTKGDLDLVVRVAPEDFAMAEARLSERFPSNDGSVRTPDFAAFADERRSPPLGIQLTSKGGRFDVFHLFAEALREDPALLLRYNALKVRFDDRPMPDYRAAKAAFVNEVLRARGVATRD